MIFGKCSNCRADVGPHNSHDIKVLNDGSPLSGLYFTHSRDDCHSTGFLPLREVEARANLKANGDPFRGLEIEWYQERLKELKNAK